MTEMLVSTSWLEANLGEADLVVLDCTAYLDAPIDPTSGCLRAQLEFRQSHIPGARFVDVEGELSDTSHPVRFMAPSAEQLSRALQRLGIGPETRIVLYSRNEVWSATRVWWVLRLYGFDRVALLDGGWKLWQREARPTAAEELTASVDDRLNRRQPFVPRPRLGVVADKEDVLAAIAGRSIILINARLPRFFSGDEGNVYGRPGRIACSVNVPAASYIDHDDRFLPLHALRALFHAVVADDAHVIAYCGYGIAASATVFVLTMLGHQHAALYDGSLAQWAPDHSLPMETGAP